MAHQQFWNWKAKYKEMLDQLKVAEEQFMDKSMLEDVMGQEQDYINLMHKSSQATKFGIFNHQINWAKEF